MRLCGSDMEISTPDASSPDVSSCCRALRRGSKSSKLFSSSSEFCLDRLSATSESDAEPPPNMSVKNVLNSLFIFSTPSSKRAASVFVNSSMSCSSDSRDVSRSVSSRERNSSRSLASLCSLSMSLELPKPDFFEPDFHALDFFASLLLVRTRLVRTIGV